MARRSHRLLIPLQVALLSLAACETEEPSKPQAGSTASSPGSATAPTPGTSNTPTPGSSAPGTTTPGSTASDTGPVSKIVPGKGDCPDAATLLAAPKFAKRDLYTGKINYRVSDPSKPERKVITEQAAYDALAQELKLTLPAVDFTKEQVLFGTVMETASCGLKFDPLRVVTVNGKTHADFTAFHQRGGKDCNIVCQLVEEVAFIVAVAKTPNAVPTLCTRNRVECTDKS